MNSRGESSLCEYRINSRCGWGFRRSASPPISFLEIKKMDILNTLVLRHQRQFPKASQVETQHFRVKLHHREMLLSVLMIMIRKSKPTCSSLHHLGKAGGKQMYCLNTWVGWRPLFGLNTKRWPSLSEPSKLNGVLFTIASSRGQKKIIETILYILIVSVPFTQWYLHRMKWLYAYSCPHWTAKGTEA